MGTTHHTMHHVSSITYSNLPCAMERRMPEQQELDPHTILAAIGFSGAAEATPVAGGADTAIWRVTHSNQLYALRVFRAEQAETCRREIAAMRAALARG